MADAESAAPKPAPTAKPAETRPESAAAPEPERRMSVSEFCTKQSKDDKRVELIAAFHRLETRKGREYDTRQNFADRLVAFANMPAR